MVETMRILGFAAAMAVADSIPVKKQRRLRVALFGAIILIVILAPSDHSLRPHCDTFDKHLR